MALAFNQQDPVQGLVDYVSDIKPFHSKIIEILVEYIHEDSVKVTINDELSTCVNFGYPNINSIFVFDIISINQSTNSFNVRSNIKNIIFPGQRIELWFSKNNNGFYYVDSITYDFNNNISSIKVNQIIPDSLDISGQIANNFIDFCPNFFDDPDRMRGTYLNQNNQILCDGGFGLIWDSLLYTALNIDIINNEIRIFGDHKDYINESPTITLIDSSLYNGIPGSEIVGVMSVANAIYDGVHTIITTVQDLSTYAITTTAIYQVLSRFIGYDDPLHCFIDNSNGRNETVFATFNEDFQMDITMDYDQSITVYDMENTNTGGFDVIDIGVINSQTEPLVPETLVPPSNPNLFDLWFDTSIGILKQWFNYGWKPIPYAYWFKEDAINIQNSTYFKLIKNHFQDSGFLPINPSLIDEVTDSFGVGAWSDEPYAVFHPAAEINRIDDNTLHISGGNFTSHLLHPTIFEGHDQIQTLGSWEITDFIVESNINNAFVLDSSLGDKTSLFNPGTEFYFNAGNHLNTKWYTIDTLSFDGINTILNVVETIDILPDLINLYQGFGSIPTVFFVPASATTPILWNGERKPTTIVYTSTILDNNIKTISYYWKGPYRIQIDMDYGDSFSSSMTNSTIIDNELLGGLDQSTGGDLTQTSITDELIFGWGNITNWFQYSITNINLTLNEITIFGNALTDIQVNQQIRILGIVDNIGIYTVQTILFNGLSTIIKVVENIPTATIGGSFIEPVDDLPIQLFFKDTVGVNAIEESGALLTTSGPLSISSDFNFLDIGPVDEDYQIIRLR